MKRLTDKQVVEFQKYIDGTLSNRRFFGTMQQKGIIIHGLIEPDECRRLGLRLTVGRIEERIEEKK